MQSFDTITTLCSEFYKQLDKELVYFKKCDVPFEEDILDVFSVPGLYFSEKYWLENLVLVTTKGIYIPFQDIITTHHAPDEFQSYVKFIEGIRTIARIYQYNSTPRATLKFILDILKRGKITCTRYIRGPYQGSYHFSFCQHCYSNI